MNNVQDMIQEIRRIDRQRNDLRALQFQTCLKVMAILLTESLSELVANAKSVTTSIDPTTIGVVYGWEDPDVENYNPCPTTIKLILSTGDVREWESGYLDDDDEYVPFLQRIKDIIEEAQLGFWDGPDIADINFQTCGVELKWDGDAPSVRIFSLEDDSTYDVFA